MLIDLNTERTKRMIEITYAQANNGEMLATLGKLIKHVMPELSKNMRLLQLVKGMELEIPKIRSELQEIYKSSTPESEAEIKAKLEEWSAKKVSFKYPKFTKDDVEGAPLAALDLLLLEPILDETTFQ